ncbi:MAG TPA: hypothetical protein VIQ30_04910 [Pseudonocardia sp.]
MRINIDGEIQDAHASNCRIWWSQLPCDCPAGEPSPDFISGVERKLAAFEAHRVDGAA